MRFAPQVSCQDVGDVIWSMQELRVPAPHHQLRMMAERSAEEDAIDGATPGAISKVRAHGPARLPHQHRPKQRRRRRRRRKRRLDVWR